VADIAPFGAGKTVFDQVAAFGDVHTVATAVPPALNWVPEISQIPLAPGATTADRVLVLPPPSANARPWSRCQL